jgi:hypothetical protein
MRRGKTLRTQENKVKLESLSMTQRLRLTEALRAATTDTVSPKVVKPEELLSIAPLLDEYKIPADQADALISGIVASFGDGSKVDPEAHKLLAAASFELGNPTGDEKLLGNMIDLMKVGWTFNRGDGHNGIGAQEAIDALRRESGSRPLTVRAVFDTGISETYDVRTQLGTQRQVSDRVQHETFRVTTVPELEAIVARGLDSRPGRTRYEDIGQGLDARNHRRDRP